MCFFSILSLLSVKECNKLIFALSASSCKCGLEGTQRIVGGEDSTVFCLHPYLCQPPYVCIVFVLLSPGRKIPLDCGSQLWLYGWLEPGFDFEIFYVLDRGSLSLVLISKHFL